MVCLEDKIEVYKEILDAKVINKSDIHGWLTTLVPDEEFIPFVYNGPVEDRIREELYDVINYALVDSYLFGHVYGRLLQVYDIYRSEEERMTEMAFQRKSVLEYQMGKVGYLASKKENAFDTYMRDYIRNNIERILPKLAGKYEASDIDRVTICKGSKCLDTTADLSRLSITLGESEPVEFTNARYSHLHIDPNAVLYTGRVDSVVIKIGNETIEIGECKISVNYINVKREEMIWKEL